MFHVDRYDNLIMHASFGAQFHVIYEYAFMYTNITNTDIGILEITKTKSFH